MRILLLFVLSLGYCMAQAQKELLHEAMLSADGIEYDAKGAILQERFPELKVTQRILIDTVAVSPAEKASIKLYDNEWTGIYENGKNHEVIKVLQRYGRIGYAKVSYIALGTKIEEPRELALSLVEKLKDGQSFDRLWERHNYFFNKNRGLLDWFRADIMVEEFRDAVISHSKGDVYAVETEMFGWMVIVQTHDPILALAREILHISTQSE